LLLEGWDEIFQFDPSQSLAAVSGVHDSWVSANLDKFKNNHSVTQAFIDGTSYLNAGVLQFRSLIWQGRYSQEWKPIARQAKSLGFSMGEQDVLNHLVKGDSGKINESLNRLVDPRSKFEPPIGIWHFAGGWKPWERSTQLRFPGKRAAHLWIFYAKRLSRELFELDSGIGENFLNRWQLLQSNSNQKISLRFPKNFIYWVLDRLVRDPSLGRR
jgi:lipopolysaccharide biosynthesis glycosyltransferase